MTDNTNTFNGAVLVANECNSEGHYYKALVIRQPNGEEKFTGVGVGEDEGREALLNAFQRVSERYGVPIAENAQKFLGLQPRDPLGTVA